MRFRIFAILLLFCAVASAQSVPAENGYYNVEYSWKYEDVQWSFSVGVPERLALVIRYDKEFAGTYYEYNGFWGNSICVSSLCCSLMLFS